MAGKSKSKIVRVLEKLSRQQGKTMLARLGRGRPFRTLVATILSARVRDEVTETVVPEVMRRWPDAESLARARPRDVEHVIRRIGLYRVKSRRLVEVAGRLVREYGGRVPNSLEELVKLPGVGRKTAGCVVVYAFGGTALPVDTHVHRISNRLGWVRTKVPTATERALLDIVPEEWQARVNDLLVHHGKTICKPLNPDCDACPVSGDCPYWRGRK
ncbi:MAG TPA: endonuclease III [Myxococcota bacterium]|nr:endonuclease III [Myxococcota bacterium]